MVHKRKKTQLYVALQLAVIPTTTLPYTVAGPETARGQVRSRKQASQCERTAKQEEETTNSYKDI